MATHISGHFAAVNSKGLEMAGYDANTENPEGGIIRRRAGSSEPNGVLEELAAIPIMMANLAPKSAEDQRYFVERGIELAMSFGYTTGQEGRAFAPTHTVLASHADNVGFPIDIVSYIDYSDTSPLRSDWYGSNYRGGYRVGGLKITLDGFAARAHRLADRALPVAAGWSGCRLRGLSGHPRRRHRPSGLSIRRTRAAGRC